MQDEELAYGLRSVAAPVTAPDGRVVAGVNLAVQARDWSTQRIIRELRPACWPPARRSPRCCPTPAPGHCDVRRAHPQARALVAGRRAASLYDAIAGGPPGPGPPAVPAGRRAGAPRGPVQRLAAAAAAGVGAAGARLRGALRHRARRPRAGRSRSWSSPRTGGPTSSGTPTRRSAARPGWATRSWPPSATAGTSALTGREAVVARTVAALVARGDLDDAEYREAVEPARPGRAVRAAHPGRLLRHARAAAPGVPRPGPGRHRPPGPADTARLDTAPADVSMICESYFHRMRASRRDEAGHV